VNHIDNTLPRSLCGNLDRFAWWAVARFNCREATAERQRRAVTKQAPDCDSARALLSFVDTISVVAIALGVGLTAGAVSLVCPSWVALLSEATVMPTHETQGCLLKHSPRINAHATFAFRRAKCRRARANLEAETVALAWREFSRLIERDREPEQFVTTLALRCVQAAKSGRGVAGGFRKREIMPQLGVARRALTGSTLRDAEHAEVGWLSDAIREDTRAQVPRRVAFQTGLQHVASGTP
jgi:hypothetical protein